MPINDLRGLIKPGLGMQVVDEISQYDYSPENGRLLIWESPLKGYTYAMGIDPAEGVGADRSVCQVIRRGDLERPDEQVAEFASDFLDPVEFADVVNLIGRFYCEDDGTEALATIEANAACGDTMITDLRSRLDYGNLYIWKVYDRQQVLTTKFGWWTTQTTRPRLIARGLHALSYNDLILNSPHLLDEMADFKRDHFMAKAAAKRGRHDDRVMALLIAYWGAHDDEWLAGEDLAEERRLRKGAKSLQAEIAHPTRKPDYQNSAISYKDMMAEADDRIFGD